MQQDFDSFKAFDVTNATVHLWVFKKSTAPQKYKAKYVQTDGLLSDKFKQIYRDEVAKFTEYLPYGHLTENNGTSCLIIDSINTDFAFLKAQVDQPEPEHRVENATDLKGAAGYVVKYSHNGHTVYGVRRSASTWKTAYKNRFVNIVFQNGELSVAEDNGFTIELNFDFYAKENCIFIANKLGFESTLKYRSAYTQAFAALQQDPNFASLFLDLQPLAQYVGTNPVHLRRMAAVIEKGVFADPNFIQNLQRVNAARNWGINFDPQTSQIIACNVTAKTIVEILLDHRLMSEVTTKAYIVPDAILQ
ncbi:MAG: Kiwa anti-phage protein KwaB-like domain-containing protein [Janthinobacterium lividum]